MNPSIEEHDQGTRAIDRLCEDLDHAYRKLAEAQDRLDCYLGSYLRQHGISHQRSTCTDPNLQKIFQKIDQIQEFLDTNSPGSTGLETRAGFHAFLQKYQNKGTNILPYIHTPLEPDPSRWLRQTGQT